MVGHLTLGAGGHLLSCRFVDLKPGTLRTEKRYEIVEIYIVTVGRASIASLYSDIRDSVCLMWCQSK